MLHMYSAALAGSCRQHLFLNCLVALETAKRKLRLGISILVWIRTRWTRAVFSRRRITENQYQKHFQVIRQEIDDVEPLCINMNEFPSVNGGGSYLLGLGSNMLGRPISSENVTVVPVGPIINRTVLDAIVKALAALSCKRMMQQKLTK
jgi:hypothetical protein